MENSVNFRFHSTVALIVLTDTKVLNIKSIYLTSDVPQSIVSCDLLDFCLKLEKQEKNSK